LLGKAIFNRSDTRCAVCHPAPLLTDLKMHDVGTRVSVDQSDRFDTPTLIEVWRTAPYLHHGRAVTLKEVVGRFNQHDEHGKTSHLTKDELDALVEYLRSL
jgi:cytochrome c peroxidase